MLAYLALGAPAAESEMVRIGLEAKAKEKTIEAEDVFKRVRLQVRQRTNGRQIPWESTSLEDEFFFDDSAGTVAKVDEGQQRLEVEAAFENEKAEWD